METVQATTEEQLYANLPATRENKPAGYPNDTYTNPNDKVAKTNGSGNKIGPAIVLKVMAGDKFNIRVNSWYKTNGASPGTPQSPLGDLLTALAGGIGNISGGHGGATTAEITSSGVLTPGVTNFLNNQSYNSSKPKAFINWIFLDEQFKYYAGSVEQVGDNEEFKTHLFNDVPVNKSGWLYVYVSNETPNIDVFFDNLQVTHIRGALLETNEYYPMGLLMKNISYRSLKNGYAENKLMFNDGTELSSKEFSDGSGLELYETPFRGYDPQIGRFWQIDEMADEYEEWSPYTFALNNPILLNDPSGLEPGCPDCPTGKLAEEKELEEVVILSSSKPKPAASLPSGLTMINTPGTLFKPNPMYMEDSRNPQRQGKYIPVQTVTICEEGCTEHDHRFSRIAQVVSEEIVTAPIPLSKLKWLKRLFNGGRIMKYQKNFVLNNVWKSWGKYMAKRGWTYQEIEKTLLHGRWQPIGGTNHLNPGNSMSIITNLKTNKSIIIDNVTKEIIHLGKSGYVY